MSKRLFKDKLIHKEELGEDLVLIKNTSDCYISKTGCVYKEYEEDRYFKLKQKPNINNGYVYNGITYIGRGIISTRVHRIVAEHFIPNPNNYKIVGHKNNIKHDNRVENLYWTTTSENTKKAYDDGLSNNDKGWDDNQSIPIEVYKHGKYICSYGSCTECSKVLDIPLSTILRRVKNEIKTNYRKYKEYDFKFM